MKLHHSRKEGQKSLLIGLISFSLVGSPSLYHAAKFIVTKSRCSRHKQGRQNESRDGDRGEGWGEWERQRTLPLFPVSFKFPTPFPFTPATWAKTGHTFQVSCVLLATQIPRHCTLLMPIQEECICDFYFQCVDLW